MSKDKYTATWVSHSSISDFQRCPRLYYLKNVYKNPQTNRKMKIMSPALALGQAVHEVLEALSSLPTKDRLKESLIERFDKVFNKVSGKNGGFVSDTQENTYKNRGKEMLRRVVNNPGPINRLAVKLQEGLPHYWLSEEENIILCGKLDWLEYLEGEDAVHIIDFKTGKNKEDKTSLQLPIYHLLVKNCQHRKVAKASYWYLETDNFPTEKILPDLDASYDAVMAIAKKIKLARQLKSFKCPEGEGGCFGCRPYERILKGEGTFIGTDEYKTDTFIFEEKEDEKTSVVL